jgi:hypothetical protein
VDVSGFEDSSRHFEHLLCDLLLANAFNFYWIRYWFALTGLFEHLLVLLVVCRNFIVGWIFNAINFCVGNIVLETQFFPLLVVVSALLSLRFFILNLFVPFLNHLSISFLDESCIFSFKFLYVSYTLLFGSAEVVLDQFFSPVWVAKE